MRTVRIPGRQTHAYCRGGLLTACRHACAWPYSYAVLRKAITQVRLLVFRGATDSMAQRGLTVREWAVEEAIRVVTKSPRTSNADAARAAVRRAAGLKAAAEAIGQLCRADDTAHLIPESIRLYLQSRISNEADGITDQNHIIRKRIRNWLLANPCELTRCRPLPCLLKLSRTCRRLARNV